MIGPSAAGASGTGADPGAAAVARGWLTAGAPHVRAVLHFGSTRSGASPGRRSAHDLFVIVDDYDGFYRAVHGRLARRPAAMLARLNRMLPPNVLHGVSPQGEAKLFVLSERDLETAVGPRPRDHFVRARLAQDVGVAAAVDDAAAGRAETLLRRTRERVVDWMRPFAPPSFDGAALARRMLEVSYASEIRPESPGRVREVFEAQRAFLEPEYDAVARRAAAEGRLLREGDDRFAYPRPAGALERMAARAWLARSRARATLRWAKYVLTFENWLDYVAAKAERRTGLRLSLTERERRWPFLFLWPKFFRVMRARGRSRARERDA